MSSKSNAKAPFLILMIFMLNALPPIYARGPCTQPHPPRPPYHVLGHPKIPHPNPHPKVSPPLPPVIVPPIIITPLVIYPPPYGGWSSFWRRRSSCTSSSSSTDLSYRCAKARALLRCAWRSGACGNREPNREYMLSGDPRVA